MKPYSHRDLTIIPINESESLVIACDSCGGIGSKERDIVKTGSDVVGFFTTQVPLMELLVFRASPISIINTLGVEMNNTGKGIIEGIKRAIKPLGLNDEIIVTGSTEENIPVCQTSLGITVIGKINKNTHFTPRTMPGAVAICVGIPKVGEEILKDEGREILTIPILMKLREKDYVQEIIPVGSKGILYELDEMARTNNLNYILDKNILIDINKSAGPATCAVVSVNVDNYEQLIKDIDIPVTKLAVFQC